jgi:hypothetical protein
MALQWESEIQMGTGPGGVQLLSVLGKQTYVFAPGKKLEVDYNEPIPFSKAQTYWGNGDPNLDPVRQEDDLVAWKPLVDVVVHGKVHAPRGKRGRWFDAGVVIAGQPKMVRVFGDRRIDFSTGGLRFTDPEPFEEMPLHWGLAYGGTDSVSNPDVGLVYPRNPVGKGFWVSPPIEKIHGASLPNLENPQHLLTPETLLVKKYDRWKAAPVPIAMGWTSRHFHDRLFDPKKTKTEAMLPAPFPNAAPAFLRLPQMTGSEPVVLGYMDADQPSMSFSLPGDVPKGYLDTGEGAVLLPTALQSIEFFPSAKQVTMLWRATIQIEDPDRLAQAANLEGWLESDFE